MKKLILFLFALIPLIVSSQITKLDTTAVGKVVGGNRSVYTKIHTIIDTTNAWGDSITSLRNTTDQNYSFIADHADSLSAHTLLLQGLERDKAETSNPTISNPVFTGTVFFSTTDTLAKLSEVRTLVSGSVAPADSTTADFGLTETANALKVDTTASTGIMTNARGDTIAGYFKLYTAGSGILLSNETFSWGGTITGDVDITTNNEDYNYSRFIGQVADTITRVFQDSSEIRLHAYDIADGEESQVHVGLDATNKFSASMGVKDGTSWNKIGIWKDSLSVRDDINSKGLVYYEDYSTNFTNRSLVDKAYVDATAGHSAVTLAGTPDYLTLSTQEITLNQIDLTTDVTGVLPDANVANDITITNISQVQDITATAAEINYVDGVTSNVQTQLDGKVDEEDSLTIYGTSPVNLTYSTSGDSLEIAISDNSISATQLISDNSISATQLASNSVDSDELIDGSIDESHLNATNSPTDNQIPSYDDETGGFTWVDQSEGTALDTTDAVYSQHVVDSLIAALQTQITNLTATVNLHTQQIQTLAAGDITPLLIDSIEIGTFSDSIFLAFTDTTDLDLDSLVNVANLYITENGTEFGVNAVTYASTGDTIFIAGDSTAAYGATYLVDLLQTSYPQLQDSTGNATVAFNNKAVTNSISNPYGPPSVLTNTDSTYLWVYDLSDNSTTVGDTVISQWDDMSGNTNNCVQSTANYRPKYSGDTLIFDRDSMVLTSSFSASQPVTIWTIVRKDSDNGQYLFRDANSTPRIQREKGWWVIKCGLI